MTVKPTSRKAYLDPRFEAARAKERTDIYLVLTQSWYGFDPGMKPMSRKQIAELTKYPSNVVCPRVKELIDGGLVIVEGVGPCPITGNMAELLRPTPLHRKAEVKTHADTDPDRARPGSGNQANLVPCPPSG